ncbi:MAG: zinc ribbon domain-containing protein [Candidatus Freyarchaeota archaeon]
MARYIYGSIPGEGYRIGEFAEILDEELNSAPIRVKRKGPFEWSVRKGINAKGSLRIYRSGSNIVYEGKVGYNYIPLILSLALTVALIIISLLFIFYGIFFSFFFLFIFLALGGADRLEYDVRTAIEYAISRFQGKPTERAPQRTEAGYGDKYCMYCGSRIPSDSVFCPKCGNKIGFAL